MDPFVLFAAFLVFFWFPLMCWGAHLRLDAHLFEQYMDEWDAEISQIRTHGIEWVRLRGLSRVLFLESRF